MHDVRQLTWIPCKPTCHLLPPHLRRYLTINFIDRFLSKHVVPRSQLQLVGVACMWVAAKYEEIYPPNVADFCYITDSTYSKEQVRSS